MPFMHPPLYAYPYAHYGYPTRHSGRTSQAAPLTSGQKTKPLTPEQKLQQLDVPKAHAEDLLNNLEGDQPYHAGKLINGKVYLITQNDTIYYGKPEHLQKLDDVQAHRTKCMDQQVRKYHTPDGLSFTVSYQKGRPYSASVTTKLLCVTVPIPHSNQTHFRQPKA